VRVATVTMVTIELVPGEMMVAMTTMVGVN